MKRTVFALSTAGLLSLVVIVGTARGQAPPPPPPPGGGATATATPTATPIPSPTPTATPIPLVLRVGLAHSRVKAGQTQKVSVTALAGASISLTVTFPNNVRDQVTGAANASGHLNFTFMQPAGVATARSRTVSVSVKATAGDQAKNSTKKYTIG